jgi:acyl-CoA thioester hydrolase
MSDARQPRSRRGDYRLFRPIPTRWADNDAFGHVNNVVYYAWFDTVVNAYLIESGVLDILRSPVVGMVIETGCTYFESVAYPETVEAGLAVARLGRSSVCYSIAIFRQARTSPPRRGTSCMSMWTGRRSGRWIFRTRFGRSWRL